MTDSKTQVEEQFDRIFSDSAGRAYSYELSSFGTKDKVIAKALMSAGLEGKTCLDIGPGTGRWLGFLNHHGAGELNAVDISAQSLERCAPVCAKTQKADLETETLDFPDNTFDVILSIEVLEHLSDPSNYISEIKRVAKPGAVVVLSLPNITSLISRIRLVFGLLPVAISADPTHVGFYRQKDLIRMFGEFGQTVSFLPTRISLNPFNAKSRFSFPSFGAISSLDDSLVFSFRVNKA